MRWTCPSERLPEALATVEAAFTPAPEEQIVLALHQMRIMCRARDGETRDVEAASVEQVVWLRQLAGYPADIAISCLQDWPKRSPYWPTWHEMHACLEEAMSQRRIMRHVVVQMMREAGVTAKRVEILPESDERRAAVVADCLKKLAEGALGPFDADRPAGETVAGRQRHAAPDEQERMRAEADLENLQRSAIPLPGLSAEALAKFGLKPPAPPERAWTTEERSGNETET